MSDPGFEPTRIDQPAVPGPSGAPPGVPGGPPPEGPTPGGPQPPDRRPWIIGGIVALIVVVAIVLLLLAGDDDDDAATDDTSTTTSTTAASTTTSSSTTTTSTTAPTTTTTAAPTTTTAPTPVTEDPQFCADQGEDPDDPDPAARTVFAAWTRGDQNCAAELMTDDAREELFSRSGAGARDVFQGCEETDDPEPVIDCAFTFEGGATHYLMNFGDADGWRVFDVTQFAD